MFNEIDGDFENVAISTFKLDLLAEHGLRKFLTGKPVTSIRQLMDQIDKYKGLRKTNSMIRGRARLSLRKEGISGQIDIIITNHGEILSDNLGLQPLKW